MTKGRALDVQRYAQDLLEKALGAAERYGPAGMVAFHEFVPGGGLPVTSIETTPSILRGFGTDPDVKEPPRAAPGLDGSVRRAHYGDGEQPWDTAVALGWAAKGAALMVIKYLRRNKGTPEKDTRDARWYYDRLVELVVKGDPEAKATFEVLVQELTEKELERITFK